MYNISAAPHIRDDVTTASIMGDVCLALMPSVFFGIVHFGVRAMFIIIISLATCVLSEYVYELLMKKKNTTNDLSAVVTGLLLALNLPPGVPCFIPFLGGIFAIIVVKQLFGGLGKNFMNPALAARCFLLISFAGIMTDFKTGEMMWDGSFLKGADAVSGATPLACLKAGESLHIPSMFLGIIPGCIGETCLPAILCGAIFLKMRNVISFKIPVSYIVSFSVIVYAYGIFCGKGSGLSFVTAHLLGGGLMFGAFFMATDYVTSPVTDSGRLIFGVLLGILTAVFRLRGSQAEGVSYAILCGNMVVPLIEKITMPVPFGREKRKYGKTQN